MDYTEIKKISLKTFLGFLGLTAVIAIISVLSGEFGELQIKILLTSLTISAASVCSMSCAAFIEKKKFKKLGISGIVLSVISAILIIAALWAEIDNEIYGKTTISFVVAAICFAHGFLLNLPEPDDKQKWVQRASSVSIGILALMITIAVCGEIGSDGYYRILAVVAIIVGLETLSIPMLMKLRTGNEQEKQTLLLEKVEGNIYRCPAGKHYQLQEIAPDSV